MHLHLLNCHGEWTALALTLGHATAIVVWMRSLLANRKEKNPKGRA